MKKLRSGLTSHQHLPLTEEDLLLLLAQYNTNSYDDCLFLAIVFCGFHALLQVGELMEPDLITKWSFIKMTLQNTLRILTNCYSYHLPYHKGDHLFEGNIIMVQSIWLSSRCPVIWIYYTMRCAIPTVPRALVTLDRSCSHLHMGHLSSSDNPWQWSWWSLFVIRRCHCSHICWHEWWCNPVNGLVGIRYLPDLHSQASSALDALIHNKSVHLSDE